VHQEGVIVCKTDHFDVGIDSRRDLNNGRRRHEVYPERRRYDLPGRRDRVLGITATC